MVWHFVEGKRKGRKGEGRIKQKMERKTEWKWEISVEESFAKTSFPSPWFENPSFHGTGYISGKKQLALLIWEFSWPSDHDKNLRTPAAPSQAWLVCGVFCFLPKKKEKRRKRNLQILSSQSFRASRFFFLKFPPLKSRKQPGWTRYWSFFSNSDRFQWAEGGKEKKLRARILSTSKDRLPIEERLTRSGKQRGEKIRDWNKEEINVTKTKRLRGKKWKERGERRTARYDWKRGQKEDRKTKRNEEGKERRTRG